MFYGKREQRGVVRAPAVVAQIHHYTIRRLRAEIEPVAARDFLTFLFTWQRVAPKARMTGARSLEVILEQLEGFKAPAAAWEAEILPARLSDYEWAWLDERCLAGHLAWLRLRPPRQRRKRQAGLAVANH